jgi:hypothetical protein
MYQLKEGEEKRKKRECVKSEECEELRVKSEKAKGVHGEKSEKN